MAPPHVHRVRFGDVDRAGIAYYPRIFHWFHVAFEEWFEAGTGIPYRALIEDRRVGFPAVKVETEFLSPLRFGDEVAFTVSVERVGGSSVLFGYAARNRTTGKDAVRARVTCACVDMGTFRPIRVPEDLRTLFGRSG
ncbi:MAG: acyl-CoA thioesterase [Planctomycetaceae bacterium]|nr:acyl-CoA thioesterase [Planctomycetota bacterium]NUN52918.1 acyl-CoA thioesterase [Planctomycetaceae bacterium]